MHMGVDDPAQWATDLEFNADPALPEAQDFGAERWQSGGRNGGRRVRASGSRLDQGPSFLTLMNA